MKITTLLGSARKAGNTALILRRFEAMVSTEHSVERFDLADYPLHGCLGCEACQDTLDEPGCIQEDEVLEVLKSIWKADLVVYASPTYCWDVSAQMKAVMDRQYCMVKWDAPDTPSLLKDKQAMLLTTCGGGAAENADLLQAAFRREMEIMQCQVVGSYVVDYCSSPSELGDRALSMAKKMYADFLRLS